MEEFLDRQMGDVEKSNIAISEGYRIIRIDYTQINNIEYHIQLAFKLEQSIYFSTPILYRHYN